MQGSGWGMGRTLGESPGITCTNVPYTAERLHPMQSSAHLHEDEVAIISLHLCIGADQERRLADQEV